jgi:hypothetical protein
MSDASTPRPRLTMLTFAPMVDSETTRFLLSHYRLAYREERHIFGWASVLTFLYGGYGSDPNDLRRRSAPYRPPKDGRPFRTNMSAQHAAAAADATEADADRSRLGAL